MNVKFLPIFIIKLDLQSIPLYSRAESTIRFCNTGKVTYKLLNHIIFHNKLNIMREKFEESSHSLVSLLFDYFFFYFFFSLVDKRNDTIFVLTISTLYIHIMYSYVKVSLIGTVVLTNLIRCTLTSYNVDFILKIQNFG